MKYMNGMLSIIIIFLLGISLPLAHGQDQQPPMADQSNMNAHETGTTLGSGSVLGQGSSPEQPSMPPVIFQPVENNEEASNQDSQPSQGEVSVAPSSVQAVAGGQSSSSMLDVLDLKNMDILDVLKLISQKSGVNIIASQNVKGRVTVYLKAVTVQEALRIIVEAYGWAFAKEGDILQVMTDKEFETKYGQKFSGVVETKIRQLSFVDAADLVNVLSQVKSESGKIIPDPKSNALIMMDTPQKIEAMEKIVRQLDVAIETKVFHLSYSKAEDLSGKITEVLTPTVGQMKFDNRSNTIVISDTAAKLKRIGKIVEAFDRKDREVLIEAKILQITLSDNYSLGIDWEAIVTDYKKLDLKGNFNVLSSTDKRGQVSIGVLDQNDYTATLQALQTVGVTNILSSPRITALNNQEAKILVGSTEPYVTTTTTTPASGPATTAESVNFIEVGVKLYVTPTIHPDNFITMKIKPEVSSVVRNLATSNNNSIPVVETSEAETTVRVKDNVTIVIGGLIKESKVKTTNKVPVLGDIPFFGNAFKSVSDQVSKTEIAIFLTPKIMTGDVPTNDVAAIAP